ncbi:hypothetical protein PV726_32535 [Streptomyces europaeiscabiei]|uniref:hypothetical protein n=1 Tax=Streptomyces europaeiscabiei TaxID=146819 RepID=UPI0029B87687|nr:hypothetical protein [Streptomyces europaeiscabiei]MDX3694986.1 hypothetical protein [Streptomyces europaeiscabiei]
MTATFYRHKLALVEARQVLASPYASTARQLATWCGGLAGGAFTNPYVDVETLTGRKTAYCNDWIVLEAGRFDVVPAEVFSDGYEAALTPNPLQDALQVVASWHQDVSSGRALGPDDLVRALERAGFTLPKAEAPHRS